MSGLDDTSWTTRTVAAATTLTANDYVLFVTTGAGAIAIALPVATSVQPGRSYIVRRDATGAGLVTLVPASGTINGAANLQVGAASTISSAEVYSDGTEWKSLGVST